MKFYQNKKEPNSKFLSRRGIILSGIKLIGARAVVTNIGVAGLLAGCGGGSNNASNDLSNANNTASPINPTIVASTISIKSVSSTTPSALSALYLTTDALNVTQPFTVSFTAAETNTPFPLQIIRTQTDGIVVIGLPLHIDAASGKTSDLLGLITISQNGITSPSISITIKDLPQLNDFGTPLGSISHAFYVHQQLALNIALNAQQALTKMPGSNFDNISLVKTLSKQAKDLITARNDVDRIITDNSTKISFGKAPDGTSIFFDKNSLELLDRVIANYLLAYSEPKNSIAAKDQERRPQEKPSILPSAMQSLVQVISGLQGTITFLTSKQTNTDLGSTTLDKVLASASLGATVLTVGAGIVAVGAGAIGAPVIAAGALAAVTYASLAGVLVGSASIGNDLIDVYTAYNGSHADLVKASSNLTNDIVATTFGAFGVGALGKVANGIVGTASGSLMKSLFDSAIKDAYLGGAVLLESAANLYIQKKDYEGSAIDAVKSMETLITTPVSPTTGLGTVAGKVNITNTQGSVLSGLTGVSITDRNTGTVFSAVADPTGVYQILVPLGNKNFDYSNMTCSAYDPLVGMVLASSVINLSSLNSISPMKGLSLSGVCSDYDASRPDGDDPDCD